MRKTASSGLLPRALPTATWPSIALMSRPCGRTIGPFRNLSVRCLLRTTSPLHRPPLPLRRSFATSGGGRGGNNSRQDWQQKNKNVGLILTSLVLGGIAISYAAVPLYQRFCQVTGYGGTTQKVDQSKLSSPDRWKKRSERPLTIKFYSNTNSNIPWVFYPLQNEVKLVPGESTLAFYRAENPSPDDIVGIASYNVVPAKAGIYFQKIQCFCFEEQLLPAKKGVDMPVYFVIDPDFADDPNMHDVESISLFYTFFRAKDFDDLNAKAYDESQANAAQPEPVKAAVATAPTQVVGEKKEESRT